MVTVGFVTKEAPKGRYLEYYQRTVERDRTLLEEIRTGLRTQPQRDSMEACVEDLLAELDLPKADRSVLVSIGAGLAMVRPRKALQRVLDRHGREVDLRLFDDTYLPMWEAVAEMAERLSTQGAPKEMIGQLLQDCAGAAPRKDDIGVSEYLDYKSKDSSPEADPRLLRRRLIARTVGGTHPGSDLLMSEIARENVALSMLMATMGLIPTEGMDVCSLSGFCEVIRACGTEARTKGFDVPEGVYQLARRAQASLNLLLAKRALRVLAEAPRSPPQRTAVGSLLESQKRTQAAAGLADDPEGQLAKALKRSKGTAAAEEAQLATALERSKKTAAVEAVQREDRSATASSSTGPAGADVRLPRGDDPVLPPPGIVAETSGRDPADGAGLDSESKKEAVSPPPEVTAASTQERRAKG